MSKDINKWWPEEKTLVTNKHMEIHIGPNSDKGNGDSVSNERFLHTHQLGKNSLIIISADEDVGFGDSQIYWGV